MTKGDIVIDKYGTKGKIISVDGDKYKMLTASGHVVDRYRYEIRIMDETK